MDFFENLPELERLLHEAQAQEDAEQDPLRAELEIVEELMLECDQDAADCAASMRRAKGRVLAKMELQQEEINSRYSDLQKRHTLILAKLEQRTFTDQTISDTLSFAADVRAGLESPDFPTKRRDLENLNVKVIADGSHYYVKCVLGKWEGDLPRPGQRRSKSKDCQSTHTIVQQTPARP